MNDFALLSPIRRAASHAVVTGRALLTAAAAAAAFSLQISASPSVATEPPPAETIDVALTSGRVFTGAVDERTDDERLWLRFDGAGSFILRPIAWERVVQVVRGETTLSAEEFRATLGTARSTRELWSDATGEIHIVRNGVAANREGIGSVHVARAEQDGTTTASEPSPAWGALETADDERRVTSLSLDAFVGGWDSDVEVDGLVLSIYPVDPYGELVPVDATLEVELIGERRGRVTHRDHSPRLGRWVKAVRVSDFGTRGAVYRLPFQGVHPEFANDISPYGIVHARLVVPGAGTFEASTGTTRIRPYNAVRDNLQQKTGRRFFETERTGRGQRSYP